MPPVHPALFDSPEVAHRPDRRDHPVIDQVFLNAERLYGPGHRPSTSPRRIYRIGDPIIVEDPQDILFYELVAQWREETGGLSSPRSITNHPAYQQIIEMGTPVLRLIFKELRENGGWWYPALRALTGTNPVPDSARGRPSLNDKAWLEWGEENGYA